MDGRFLPLLLFCWVFVPASCLATVSSYIIADEGSGAKCARGGRECVVGTRCVRNRCQCPSGLQGNAEFECTSPEKQVCYMTGAGTSNIQGYGGATAAVNLPCSYRATTFVTSLSDGLGYCSVEVHVTNELARNNYVARAVHVTVGVSESARLLQTFTDVMVTGSMTRRKVYDYVVRESPLEISAWGSAVQPTRTARDIINATVDKADNFVVIDLPMCETRIKFRAYDSTHNTQGKLPGVSVSVPPTSHMVPGYGDYPHSLCGRAADSGRLYRQQAAWLGLDDASLAITSDVLLQRAPQFDNPKSEECSRAMDLLEASSDQREHLKACSFLLFKKRLRACLSRNGLAPVDMFNACLSFQQQATDRRSCQQLRTASNKCRGQWSGFRNFRCQ